MSFIEKKWTKDLARWFERQKRVLPWRDNPAIYPVWVSEIMLQQTQVATVIPYFERFISRFPNVEALAQASEQEVLLSWSGLGYYSRARNIHKAAKQIRATGRFPQTQEEWLEIPGVGPYTAGAILSIALNQPEAILDGNVERVLSRLKKIGRENGDTKFKEALWALSREGVSLAFNLGIQPSVFNQAMMELGAVICTPKNPKCDFCPLSNFCEARASGDQENFPPRKASKKWIKLEEQMHCVLNSREEVLLEKRNPGEWRAGLWDFPQDSPRKIFPDLKFQKLGQVKTNHVVTKHKITRITTVWRAQAWIASENCEDLKWVSGLDLNIPVGSALKRTLNEIREKFPEAGRRN